MTDERRVLRDVIHDLAGDVAPSSAATARARDRAHHGIVRHRRNQRAAIAGLATVVLLAGLSAAFALGRDSRHSTPPVGDTTTLAPTTTTTTSVEPSTVAPGPIVVPPIADLQPRPSSWRQTFAWGRGTNEVAFSVPHGEGVSGGPAAFTSDPSRDVTFFDYSNARVLLDSGRAAPSERHIDLPSPAVTAAVFDRNGFAIAAQPGLLLVYRIEDGARTTIPYPGLTATRLAAYGKTVYAVGDDGSLRPLIHLTANGYERGGTLDEPAAVSGGLGTDGHHVTLSVPSTGAHYELTTSDAITGIPAAVRLPDGSIDFVLATDQSSDVNIDRPLHFVLGHISPSGPVALAAVTAPTGYLLRGPQFELDDAGIGVMGSTTTQGVTVSFYEP